MKNVRAVLLVAAGFITALIINFNVLPGDHIVSSLYLIPVLAACHLWRPRAVAVTAVFATMLYLISARVEQRPLAVWPFGVLALAIGGYLTVQYALQREEIARRAGQESEQRRRLQLFMAMVAHDLAGSVTNIMAGAEMLGDRSGHQRDESDRVAIAAINSGAYHANQLLTDLRDAAAIGSGQFRVVPEGMELVELAGEIVVQQQMTNPRHDIVLDAPDRLVGSWDRQRVGQLLANLVSNACKYSPSDRRVLVVVRASGQGATISVRDHGVGINLEQQGIIFEPFVRADSYDEAPGTGLGLWISKVIAESHGGRIDVESERGEGSNFTVVLPSAAARAGTRPNPRSSPMRASRPQRTNREQLPARHRVATSVALQRTNRLGLQEQHP